MGKLKTFQLQLHINQNLTPFQQLTRYILYHTRIKVAEKIKRSQDLKIIEPVSGLTSFLTLMSRLRKPTVKNDFAQTCESQCFNHLRTPYQCRNGRNSDRASCSHHLSKTRSTKRLPLPKLDLQEGYHYLEFHLESRRITTFAFHKGIFQCKQLIHRVNSAFEYFLK